MDDWIEEDLRRQSEVVEEAHRDLEQRMIKQPIQALDPPAAIALHRDASLADAVALMRSKGIGCVLVVEDDRLVGLLTERDLLLKVLGRVSDLDAVPLSRYMTPDPEVLHLEDPIVFALNKMSLGGFRHVPLVDQERRPVGVVSVKLIVQYIVEFFPQEVSNLPPEPGKNVAHSREGA